MWRVINSKGPRTFARPGEWFSSRGESYPPRAELWREIHGYVQISSGMRCAQDPVHATLEGFMVSTEGCPQCALRTCFELRAFREDKKNTVLESLRIIERVFNWIRGRERRGDDAAFQFAREAGNELCSLLAFSEANRTDAVGYEICKVFQAALEASEAFRVEDAYECFPVHDWLRVLLETTISRIVPKNRVWSISIVVSILKVIVTKNNSGEGAPLSYLLDTLDSSNFQYFNSVMRLCIDSVRSNPKLRLNWWFALTVGGTRFLSGTYTSDSEEFIQEDTRLSCCPDELLALGATSRSNDDDELDALLLVAYSEPKRALRVLLLDGVSEYVFSYLSTLHENNDKANKKRACISIVTAILREVPPGDEEFEIFARRTNLWQKIALESATSTEALSALLHLSKLSPTHESWLDSGGLFALTRAAEGCVDEESSQELWRAATLSLELTIHNLSSEDSYALIDVAHRAAVKSLGLISCIVLLAEQSPFEVVAECAAQAVRSIVTSELNKDQASERSARALICASGFMQSEPLRYLMHYGQDCHFLKLVDPNTISELAMVALNNDVEEASFTAILFQEWFGSLLRAPSSELSDAVVRAVLQKCSLLSPSCRWFSQESLARNLSLTENEGNEVISLEVMRSTVAWMTAVALSSTAHEETLRLSSVLRKILLPSPSMVEALSQDSTTRVSLALLCSTCSVVFTLPWRGSRDEWIADDQFLKQTLQIGLLLTFSKRASLVLFLFKLFNDDENKLHSANAKLLALFSQGFGWDETIRVVAANRMWEFVQSAFQGGVRVPEAIARSLCFAVNDTSVSFNWALAMLISICNSKGEQTLSEDDFGALCAITESANSSREYERNVSTVGATFSDCRKRAMNLLSSHSSPKALLAKSRLSQLFPADSSVASDHSLWSSANVELALARLSGEDVIWLASLTQNHDRMEALSPEARESIWEGLIHAMRSFQCENSNGLISLGACARALNLQLQTRDARDLQGVRPRLAIAAIGAALQISAVAEHSMDTKERVFVESLKLFVECSSLQNSPSLRSSWLMRYVSDRRSCSWTENCHICLRVLCDLVCQIPSCEVLEWTSRTRQQMQVSKCFSAPLLVLGACLLTHADTFPQGTKEDLVLALESMLGRFGYCSANLVSLVQVKASTQSASWWTNLLHWRKGLGQVITHADARAALSACVSDQIEILSLVTGVLGQVKLHE